MIRVLIADDHPIVGRGLRELLEEARDIVVEGEAADAAEALAQVRRRRWDVLVLDLHLPDRSGLEVLRDVKQERPDLPVLFLTIASEEQFAIRALRAGAAGYLTKETAPEELVAAVRKVVRGGRYVSPAVAERLAFLLDKDADHPRPRAALESGVPGLPHARLGADSDTGRGGIAPEREDRQHLLRADPREDGVADERRAHDLRRAKRPRRIARA